LAVIAHPFDSQETGKSRKYRCIRTDGGDMELLMIYKISPHPSLLKRGRKKQK
jgi:hypothetical protein